VRLRRLSHRHPQARDARAGFCGTITEFAANLGKENFSLLGETAGGDRNARRYLDVAERNLDAALDIGEMPPTLPRSPRDCRPPGYYFGSFRPGPFSFDDDGLGSHRTLGNRHVSILDDHDQVFGRMLRFSLGAMLLTPRSWPAWQSSCWRSASPASTTALSRPSAAPSQKPGRTLRASEATTSTFVRLCWAGASPPRRPRWPRASRVRRRPTEVGRAVVLDATLSSAPGAEFAGSANTLEVHRDATVTHAAGDRLPVLRAADGTA
jgi:hypothetical protein